MEDSAPVEDKRVNASVSLEDAVLVAKVEVRVDLIDELRKLAKKSDNTIDDGLVEMIAMGKSNLDWKGFAKGIL